MTYLQNFVISLPAVFFLSSSCFLLAVSYIPPLPGLFPDAGTFTVWLLLVSKWQFYSICETWKINQEWGYYKVSERLWESHFNRNKIHVPKHFGKSQLLASASSFWLFSSQIIYYREKKKKDLLRKKFIFAPFWVRESFKGNKIQGT